MPRGGARSRSGPPPDPRSERSEKLGVRFGKLPRAGYTGRLPAWPLTTPATKRERSKWTWAWRTPQAAAWATEPWRNVLVGEWVRAAVRAEEPDAPAALITASLRLADQIGLTPSGMALNRWEIEEVPGARAGAEPASPAEPKVPKPPASTPLRDRLKVVRGAGDG